jgi:hypothetical protein
LPNQFLSIRSFSASLSIAIHFFKENDCHTQSEAAFGFETRNRNTNSNSGKKCNFKKAEYIFLL